MTAEPTKAADATGKILTGVGEQQGGDKRQNGCPAHVQNTSQASGAGHVLCV